MHSNSIQNFWASIVVLVIVLTSHIASEEDGGTDQSGTCHANGKAGSQKCQNQSKSAKHGKYTKESNLASGWLAMIEEVHDQYAQDADTEDLVIGFGKLIEKDLKPFSSGVTKSMIETARNRGVLYRIKDHKLYRSDKCNFPARCSGIEHFLLAIITDLEDMELIINVSDWPQVNGFIPNPFPVFSFSKNNEFADIMYPAWTFWEGGPAISTYPKGIGRWDLLRKQILEVSKSVPWEKKEDRAFFRGSRTSAERDPLILLSREQPDLVDAQYTKNQAWKSDKDTLGMPAAQEVRFEDHCKYKYLFNYRGVAASFRYKHLFLCNSLVFQVGTEWQEFFYPLLKPWYHYIPVDSKATKDDLRTLLQFANSNDEKVKNIAQNGFRWVKKNLRMKTVKQYWLQLLTAYRRLIKYEIPDNGDLIQIK